MRRRANTIAGAVRLFATVSNVFILIPYAALFLFISFAGDYDPWPHAGWAVAYLLVALSTSLTLMRRAQSFLRRCCAFACSLGHVMILIQGVLALINKADAVSWPDHAVRVLIPLTLVPTISIPALISLCFGRAAKDECEVCGYELNGLPGPICPECGKLAEALRDKRGPNSP